jgi:uncharacterized protein
VTIAKRERAPLVSPNLQFVFKTSKYCNLRCTYCYEYNELGVRRRMSLDIIRSALHNIANFAADNGVAAVNFAWHGGEPFLIPLDFYAEVGTLQNDVFDDGVVTNDVQTNLTVLTERHIEFLKSKTFFTALGVSFDPYGDQRVDIRGRVKTDLILANIQKLIDNKIDFSAIAVVVRETVPHVKNIFRFFDRIGVRFRLLPFYQSAFDEQVAAYALAGPQIVAAFTGVFDEWIASAHATTVAPLDDCLSYAINYMAGHPSVCYDKERDESVFVVGVDGGVWGDGEISGEEFRYGNLIEDGFAALLKSENRMQAVERSRRLMHKHCGSCRFLGACPGHFVAEASPQQQRTLEEFGCPERAVIDHIVNALRSADLGNLIANNVADRSSGDSPLRLNF